MRVHRKSDTAFPAFDVKPLAAATAGAWLDYRLADAQGNVAKAILA